MGTSIIAEVRRLTDMAEGNIRSRTGWRVCHVNAFRELKPRERNLRFIAARPDRKGMQIFVYDEGHITGMFSYNVYRTNLTRLYGRKRPLQREYDYFWESNAAWGLARGFAPGHYPPVTPDTIGHDASLFEEWIKTAPRNGYRVDEVQWPKGLRRKMLPIAPTK